MMDYKLKTTILQIETALYIPAMAAFYGLCTGQQSTRLYLKKATCLSVVMNQKELLIQVSELCFEDTAPYTPEWPLSFLW